MRVLFVAAGAGMRTFEYRSRVDAEAAPPPVAVCVLGAKRFADLAAHSIKRDVLGTVNDGGAVDVFSFVGDEQHEGAEVHATPDRKYI